MWLRLFRWLLPVPLALACCLPPAHAQPSAYSTEAKDEKAPPAVQYALAVLFTILVLLLICVPSRKSQ